MSVFINAIFKATLNYEFDNFVLQAFINHGNDGREMCQGTDSFNNHLLHIACKRGNQSTLKVGRLSKFH